VGTISGAADGLLLLLLLDEFNCGGDWAAATARHACASDMQLRWQCQVWLTCMLDTNSGLSIVASEIDLLNAPR
jgi:hypothetical protein